MKMRTAACLDIVVLQFDGGMKACFFSMDVSRFIYRDLPPRIISNNMLFTKLCEDEHYLEEIQIQPLSWPPNI